MASDGHTAQLRYRRSYSDGHFSKLNDFSQGRNVVGVVSKFNDHDHTESESRALEARSRLERLLVQIRSLALQPFNRRVHWKAGFRRDPGIERERRRVYDEWINPTFRCER